MIEKINMITNSFFTVRSQYSSELDSLKLEDNKIRSKPFATLLIRFIYFGLNFDPSCIFCHSKSRDSEPVLFFHTPRLVSDNNINQN